MKRCLLLVLVAAISAQETTTKKQTPEIITETSNTNIDGYNFAFKTSDGVSRQEEAHLITIGEHQGIGIKGSYSYDGPDGKRHIVKFTADEKGFRPEIQIASVENASQ